MTLFVDNFDSFSYILLDYILRIDPDCEVVRNDVIPGDLKAEYSRLVISPGPMAPGDSGSLNRIIERYLGKIPVLGVCLGHQAIGQMYGAELGLANEPVHGKTSLVKHNEDAIFEGVANPFQAVRYHSLILRDIPNDLELISWTESDEIMGFKSSSDLVYGLQFHPEAQLTEGGFNIIKNWLALT